MSLRGSSYIAHRSCTWRDVHQRRRRCGLIGGGDIDQIYTLLADHDHCPDGDYGRHSGGRCGIGRRVTRRCVELGDECPHPR